MCSAGEATETRHAYYSTQWQVLEERLGTATTVNRQFVWGQRFVDDLVLRNRDTNADGTLAVRGDHSLVYELVSGGHSDDKGRNARGNQETDAMARTFCFSLFGRKEAQEHSRVYVKGLLGGGGSDEK